MNYADMLTEMIHSKKVNIGAATGSLVTFAPTLMRGMGLSGDPIIVQVLLGLLAIAYILIQGHADGVKEATRIQALREFAGMAISKGVSPDKLIGMLKELDGVIREVETAPADKPQFTEAEKAAFVNLLRYGNRAGQPKTQAEGTSVAFPVPDPNKPAA